MPCGSPSRILTAKWCSSLSASRRRHHRPRSLCGKARNLGLSNFSVFCNHVTIVPPIRAILESPDLRLDGFLGPGHVSTVVGQRPYRFVPAQYHKPLVTAGFEPLDILQAIVMLLEQLRSGRCEVENQYRRVVPEDGNPRALALLDEVFELRPHFEWRGLGFISQSGLKLRPELAAWDAELRFEVPGVRVADPKACQCGEVLKGVIKPWECKVFGTACTPETPIGTCMVSSEGACAAYYNFGRLHREAAVSLGRHRLRQPCSRRPLRAGPTIGQVPGQGDRRCSGRGFRPFVHRLAADLGLGGLVGNDTQGVFLEVEGAVSALIEFDSRLRADKPPMARIDDGGVGGGPPHRRPHLPYRREPRFDVGFHLCLTRHVRLRRLPGGDVRPHRSALSLSLHQLHQLRSALHHHP